MSKNNGLSLPLGTVRFSFLVVFTAVLVLSGFFVFTGTASASSCSINVISPNGGEVWNGTHNITWTGTNCTQNEFDIFYSNDSGSSYHNFVDSYVGVSGSNSYSWNTTSFDSSSHERVKVCDKSDHYCNTSNSNFTLNNVAPAITTQPVNQTVTFGDAKAIFIAVASGTPAPNVQWSVSTDNGWHWNDVAGATSPNLTILNPTVSENGNLYVAKFTNGVGLGVFTLSAKLIVNKATSTVTVVCPISGQVYTGSAQTPCTATYTTSDGLNGPLDVNYSGNTNVGTANAGASYTGDSNHSGNSGTGTFGITQASQSISVTKNAPSSADYNSSFDVSANTTSGLDVAITTTGGCSGSGTNSAIVTMTSGTDACVVHYNQSGNLNFSSAPEVVENVSANKIDQTITFTIDDHTFGDPNFDISASSSSLLPVGFSVSSGECTLDGSTVSIAGAGDCTILASQPGDGNYNPTSLSRTFKIDAANQTITFGALSDKKYGDTDFTVSATSDSGLAVTFATSESSNCTISGNTVSITGAGSCTIIASQTGDDNYNPASDVSQKFSISKADAVINVIGHTGIYDGSAHGATGTAIGVSDDDNLNSLLDFGSSFKNVTGGSASWTFAGDENYNPASGSADIVINPAVLTITASTASMTYGDTAPTITPSYDGFVNGETSENLTTQPTCSTTATSTSNVGTYPSTCSGAEDANYTISYTDGSVTVGQATAKINVTPYSVTYDGNVHTAAVVAAGVNGEDLSADIDLSKTTHTDVGNYGEDSWTFKDPAGNYADASGTVSDVINAQPTPPPSGGTGGGGSYYTSEPALQISNVDSPSFTTTSLTLTWTTNLPSSTYVIYSADGESHILNMADNSENPPLFGYAHATQELDINPKVTSHSITVTGLNPLTTYFFRTVSRGSLAVSTEYKTTTPAVAGAQTSPINLTSENVGAGTANLSSPAVTAPKIEQVQGTQAVSEPSSPATATLAEQAQTQPTDQQNGNNLSGAGAASLLTSAKNFFTSPITIIILIIILILLGMWAYERISGRKPKQ